MGCAKTQFAIITQENMKTVPTLIYDPGFEPRIGRGAEEAGRSIR